MADKAIQPKSIKQNMMWYSAGSITYLGCQWLLSVVVARMSAGFDDAGALALAIGNIFTPLAYYNTRTYQVSDVRNEYTDEQYVAFRIITTFLAFVACTMYAVLTAGLSLAPVVAFLVYKSVVVIIDILTSAIPGSTTPAPLSSPRASRRLGPSLPCSGSPRT